MVKTWAGAASSDRAAKEVEAIGGSSLRYPTVRIASQRRWGGRSRLTMRQALDLDIEYAVRRSFALDLLIVAKTALVLLVPRGGAR